MKEFIKSTLRENTKKNSLGIVITRPNQELVIMRGIPGAGKSTKAKSIVGEGRIHSTDEVIESMGDYREFFKVMNESKDFSALSRAHHTNFLNASKSMMEGISPVIIDNTHIKPSEAKKIVIEALNMGYDDDKITIVDVGTAGLTAEELFKRNTHGVPLDKIKMMIQSYSSTGALSVKSIVESKDMFNNTSNVLYAGVILDAASRNKLIEKLGDRIPQGWDIIAHHMTIVFGKPVKDRNEIGKEVTLTVTEIGKSDMAIAVKVTGYPSANAIPHITLGVNPNGGKAVMSNDITQWQPVKPFIVMGRVSEVLKGNKNEK